MNNKTKMNIINAVLVVFAIVTTLSVFAVVDYVKNPSVANHNDISALKKDLNK